MAWLRGARLALFGSAMGCGRRSMRCARHCWLPDCFLAARAAAGALAASALILRADRCAAAQCWAAPPRDAQRAPSRQRTLLRHCCARLTRAASSQPLCAASLEPPRPEMRQWRPQRPALPRSAARCYAQPRSAGRCCARPRGAQSAAPAPPAASGGPGGHWGARPRSHSAPPRHRRVAAPAARAACAPDVAPRRRRRQPRGRRRQRPLRCSRFPVSRARPRGAAPRLCMGAPVRAWRQPCCGGAAHQMGRQRPMQPWHEETPVLSVRVSRTATRSPPERHAAGAATAARRALGVRVAGAAQRGAAAATAPRRTRRRHDCCASAAPRRRR